MSTKTKIEITNDETHYRHHLQEQIKIFQQKEKTLCRMLASTRCSLEKLRAEHGRLVTAPKGE